MGKKPQNDESGEGSARKEPAPHPSFEHTGLYDPLTGLLSRAALLARLRGEFSAAKRHGHALSLCLCAISHLSGINRDEGPEAGDHVLKAIGEVIAASKRGEDVAGRYGSEEMCLIFPYSSALHAANCINRIAARASGLQFSGEWSRSFGVRLHFGLADRKANHVQEQQLMEAADRALYEARENNRILCIHAE
jgi:diguanylate cyclase (GGDEF)-like protein